LNQDISVERGKALPLFFYTAIFAAIAIVIQGMAVIFGYDPSMQVYKTGFGIGKVSGFVLIAEIIVFTVITIFVLKGKTKLKAIPPSSDTSAFLSAAVGCIIIVSSLILFFETKTKMGTIRTITTAMAVLSLPSGIFFILSSLNKKHEVLMSYLGYLPILWSMTCLFRVYFDVGAAINDPIRNLFQISFAAIMLALLYEHKIRIGKSGTMPLIIFSGISIILGFASVLSMTLLFIIPKTVTTGEILLSASELFICLDLLAKMYSELKDI
jgi:hypothetical protein